MHWKKNLNLYNFLKQLENKIIFQPELSTYIYYAFNELLILDNCVSNKFLLKLAFIKSLNSLNKNYLKMYNKFSEDALMNYIIYRTSKSYYFLKKIGYYYIRNFESISNSLFFKTELRLKCILIFLKIIYDYSKNTKYEKDILNIHLTNFILELDKSQDNINIKKKEIMKYFYVLIKEYIDCKFINNDNKNSLEKYKIILKNNLEKN